MKLPLNSQTQSSWQHLEGKPHCPKEVMTQNVGSFVSYKDNDEVSWWCSDPYSSSGLQGLPSPSGAGSQGWRCSDSPKILSQPLSDSAEVFLEQAWSSLWDLSHQNQPFFSALGVQDQAQMGDGCSASELPESKTQSVFHCQILLRA